MQLTFSLSINDNAWYPTAELTGFKSESGGSADVHNKMVLVFTGPGKVAEGDINVESSPWREFKKTVESSEVGSGLFDIKVTLAPVDGQPLGDAVSKVHIGLNKSSDTAPEWSDFADTFAAAADEDPAVAGMLVVNCAAAPAGLDGTELELVLVRGDSIERLAPKFGQVSSFPLSIGTYSVSANALKTADATLCASTTLSSGEVAIKKGESAALNVAFGAVKRGTTLDVTLDLSAIPELAGEDLQVRYAENNVVKMSFTLQSGQTQRLEGLPVAGGFTVSVAGLKLNNTDYQFSDRAGNLDGKYHQVDFTGLQVSQKDERVSGAQKLTVNVRAEKAVAGKALTLRLVDTSSSVAREYRIDAIPAQNGSVVSPFTVAPGTYAVKSDSFILDSIVHYTDVTPSPLTVVSGAAASLTLEIIEGADLRVKGFPDYLSFGACANMSPSNVDDFVAARVSSIFKYSGDDGMGDADVFLAPEKEPTNQVIQMARNVSAKLGDAMPVLPMMVSYTCNLSLGDVEKIIKDPVRHKYSFANFIQALQMAQAMKDDEHPVPAGFIVNPDYLGECQKSGFAPTLAIPVREPLAEALEHHGVDIAIPAGITNTLKGYVKAVNWLTRVVAPDVVLGWQVNLWGVAGSQWIYHDFEYEVVFDPADGKNKKMTITPQRAGQLTAEYALLVGIFEDTAFERRDGTKDVAKGADFMAIDRYEADDFTLRSYANGYCYSPYEWARTFDFCAAVSRYLRKPVLPWQFPASHLATKMDQVDAAFDEQHWGSGGSYILGHAEIGSSVDAINDTLLDLAFSPAFVDMMGNDTRELFSRHTWDLTEPKYMDFPARGIFHVQLGGGATTGVVSAVGDTSNWVRNRLNVYRNNPVPFADPSDKRK
ncbi:hypothetical protein [Enterobacillus tribolii]|uniref:Hydroxymethyltransferase n=1 Tax=Enterobacillus tribolii TaxID=1487935 RepID=A0A370R3K3_9GAMM|nr:hypothetical protein [Enterobacillus tribolii]MBW7984038.1 hypothetical protein [Enterobacillus tribolii]RDK96979.1 hypothetical protein C8D90_101417 [Enterobacillus tribolii]